MSHVSRAEQEELVDRRWMEYTKKIVYVYFLKSGNFKIQVMESKEPSDLATSPSILFFLLPRLPLPPPLL